MDGSESHLLEETAERTHEEGFNTHATTIQWKIPLKCPTCKKQFVHEAQLKHHMQLHTNEHPYMCSTCGKIFKSARHLKTHQTIHSGERRFKCPLCDKRFTTAVNLKYHHFIHTGERPYKCPTCEKSFSQPGNLKTHMLKHTGERPHKCSECQFSFYRRSSLNSHMMTHSDQSRYKCSECGRGFKQSQNFKRHMMVHTGERPFSCKMCGKSFGDLGNLKRHAFTHRKNPNSSWGKAQSAGTPRNARRVNTRATTRPLAEREISNNVLPVSDLNGRHVRNNNLAQVEPPRKTPSRRGRPKTRAGNSPVICPQTPEQSLLPPQQLYTCPVASVLPMPPVVAPSDMVALAGPALPLQDYQDQSPSFRPNSMSLELSPERSGTGNDVAYGEWPEDLEELVREWDNLPHGQMFETTRWLAAPATENLPVPRMVSHVQEMMSEWDETFENKTKQVMEWLGYSVDPTEDLVEVQPSSSQSCELSSVAEPSSQEETLSTK